MKNTFKLLTLLIAFLMTINSSFAISTKKIEKLIQKSPFNETATIAISIQNTSNGNMVFEKNQNKLLHPASILKLLTAYEAYNILGEDYLFRTQFYKDNNNNLYIKLGADPFLTSAQISKAFEAFKNADKTEFNNLYIDDSIIDKKEISQGVMWNDDFMMYAPKVSAYNLDGNLFKINITKEGENKTETKIKSSYPTGLVSFVQTDAKNNEIAVERYNWNNPELIEIYGNIQESTQVFVPVSSMRRYFIHNIEKAIEDNKFEIQNTSFASKLVPQDATLLVEITNPIKPTLPLILQNSNNLIAETLFKLAGGKYYSSTGSDQLGIEAFKEFYKKKGLKTEEINICEGSGISRYNLISANWATNALTQIYKADDFKTIKEFMAQPGDGTLRDRLHELRGETILKTGSLKNVSSLYGYVKSLDGNTYAVSIITQNFKEDSKIIKDFEDEIIKLIYSK